MAGHKQNWSETSFHDAALNLLNVLTAIGPRTNQTITSQYLPQQPQFSWNSKGWSMSSLPSLKFLVWKLNFSYKMEKARETPKVRGKQLPDNIWHCHHSLVINSKNRESCFITLPRTSHLICFTLPDHTKQETPSKYSHILTNFISFPAKYCGGLTQERVFHSQPMELKWYKSD